MSHRELKALGITVSDKGDSQNSKRTTRNTRNAMSEERIRRLEQELAAAKSASDQKERELAELKATNESKDRELAELQAAVEDGDRVREEKDRELATAKAQCAEKHREVEEMKVRFELDQLRAIERLRKEQELELKNERQQRREEQVRADIWINDLKAHFGAEKDRLLERIHALEEELNSKADPAESVPPSTIDSTSTTETSTASTSTTTTATTATTRVSGTSTVTTATETIASTATSTGDSVATRESASTPTSTMSSDLISTAAGGRAETTTTSTVSTITTPAVTCTSTTTSGDLQTILGEFLEAQKRVMVQAAAAQSLPTLPKFSGDGNEDDENSFSRWHESFEERALLMGWTPEQKLCQLKAHLEKTALQVFRMMPETERTKYDAAVTALKKRFRRVEIQELRGLEFCRKLQGDESVEQLGMDLQRMARRAFSNMPEAEFNRLLKGRFFQALQVKWQRKLGAPKPDESFQDLYDRARLLEQYEKQYSDTVAVRNESQVPKPNPATRNRGPVAAKPKSQAQPQVSSATTASSTLPQRPSDGVSKKQFTCYRCHGVGHLARNCTRPPRSAKQQESPGRSDTSNSRVSAVEASHIADDLTVEQLEELLSRKRLVEEQKGLKDKLSTVSAVTASATDVGAIGPTLFLSVSIEGEKVEAMVDCGSPTTIISRSLLYSIARNMQSQGRKPPELTRPVLKLYGKDGKRELVITAQTTLTIEADGESACVPVFIQPDSEQPCLLGMNALPSLGLSFCRANGEPITCKFNPTQSLSANVCLIQTTHVPARTGKFLEAKLNVRMAPKTHMIFEPEPGVLESCGLSSQESLLTISPDRNVLIPIQNFQKCPVELTEGMKLGKVESMSKSPITVQMSDVNVLCAPVTLEESEKQKELLASLKLPESTLTDEQSSELSNLIEEYSDVFAMSKSELGCCDLVEHEIDTDGHSPIKLQPYRLPVIQREKVAQMIQEMKDQGVIKPSSSPWSSPIVLVPKRDGSLRFCVDYRRLNSITKKDVYPLPRIEEILVTLGKAKYFSTLDLAAGYWQIKLDPASAQKTAFTSHCGLYEFTRMPFGLCNAPATFQRLMQTVLTGLEWKSCFVYIDDILVASETFDEHLIHLRQVFERLKHANLRLKPTKCLFLRDEVPYLGYVISKDGIRPDPARTSQVKHFPTPKDATQVRQFIGLASYYRRFIPGFAKVASPLHALTRKGVAFEWSSECEAAFNQLKSLLVTAPVLAYPQFGPNHSFILETDASGCGLGAVLSQEQPDGKLHPIAYASRSLHNHERNYAISELETLGLVWSVKHFRMYLLGHHCTVYTDHSACVSLLNTPKPSAKLARWAMTIQEFDLTIKHRAGRVNQRADALSRNPADVTETNINVVTTELSSDEMETNDASLSETEQQRLTEIRRLQREDTELKEIIQFLEDGKLPEKEASARRLALEKSRYEMIDGVLYFENSSAPGKSRIAVPQELRLTLISESHDGKFSGHFGEQKVYNLLRKSYWWDGMRADIRRYYRSCLVCATRKGTGRASRPPLQPIPVGGPFHRVGVDVLQLPKTFDGNCYVVVFADYLTKWVEAFPTSDQKAETIAKLFVESVVSRHGVPEELLSDRGPNFLSELIQEICNLLGVKKINTSGYHPQCDGLVEKFNSTLIGMIAKSVENRANDWDRHLPYLLFSYRVSVQDSTKESPFFLLYGRDPQLPTETALTQSRTPYMIDVDDYKTEMVTSLSDAWKIAQENIKVAQTKQKTQYDKKSKEPTFSVGDRVMTYMPSEVQGKNWKLARPFYGPYRILNLTPTNAEIRLVDKPTDPSIFVSLNRLRPCYSELRDVSWSGRTSKRKKKLSARNKTTTSESLSTNNVSSPNRRVTRSMTCKK